MPVQKNPNAKHPAWEALAARWEKVRDFVAGSDRVKKQGTRYLPMLSGQESSDYEGYKLRALFFAVTQRTLGAFVGMVFRKPATVTAAQSTIDGWLSRCTVKRTSVENLERNTFRELCMQSRVGLLVDLPMNAPANAEPWIAVYSAESIINWRYGADEKGSARLEFVVLKEEVEEKGGAENPDETVCVPQWREIELMPAADGKVSIMYSLWRETQKKSGSEQGYERVRGPEPIVVNGRPLQVFPFEIVDLPDDEGELTPPMEAIADVNHSHYLTSADLEHGRHYTALPTPYVTGVEKKVSLKIGSQTAWVLSDTNAKVGMLEFTGQGLQALEKGLEQKRDMAAALGARMLEDAKKAVEATQTHEIRRSGETSILATIARQASIGLNKVMTIATSQFLPVLGDIEIELNTDFSATSLSAQDLTALVSALQSGAISEETFFYNLEQAEMYEPGLTFDEESKRRQAAFDKGVNNEAARLAKTTPLPLDNNSVDNADGNAG